MKKITLILILLTTLTVTAQNDNKTISVNEKLTLNTEQNSEVNQHIKLNIVTTDLSSDKVIVLVKHETIKASSRRSRVKNIVNFLKSSEKKQNSTVETC